MKYSFQLLILLCSIFAGCETPQQKDSFWESPPIDGVKLFDLQAESAPAENESLMRFKILTYSMVPSSVDELKEVVDSMSQREIRISNKRAFHGNGFMIGVASSETAGQIAKKLNEMGADRTSQSWLMFPPNSTEALSRTILQEETVIQYTKSTGSAGTIKVKPGFLGWAFSAKPDLRFRGMAQVKLYPATWQPGIKNIRLVMGKEAIDYQPVREGQVLARIEEGGVILLGPVRNISEETTLDKQLFFLPGQRPKMQFFVILCDSVGT
jgi:hypothetical protein